MSDRTFTKEELLLLCETHADAGVRRAAGQALYTMGAADSAKQALQKHRDELAVVAPIST